jgi:hypothetical protein
MRRCVQLGLVLLTTSGLAACQHRSPVATPHSPTVAPSATSTSTAPSPSPEIDLATLKSRAQRAAIPVDAFKGKGVAAPNEDKYGQWAVTVMCGKQPSTNPDWRTSYLRLWSNKRIFVQNFVHAYAADSATRTVADVRSAHATCQQYQPGDGDTTTRKVLAPIPLANLPVEDSFAYCEDAGGATLCFAFLARGNLVSVVVTATSGTAVADTRGDLLAVIPIAANALASA